MDLNLSGKYALVCGASEGIGRAAALALAEQGANVTVLARREPVLAELVAALSRTHSGQSHAFLVADMSDRSTLKSVLDRHVAKGPVHILVNNTAGPAGGPAHAAAPEHYLAVFEQHLIANQILLQAVLRA